LKKILTANRWLGRRSSSMKKPFLITAIITTSVATLATSNAQGIIEQVKSKGQEMIGSASDALSKTTAPTNTKDALDRQMEQINAEIIKAREALKVTTKPNEEKLKEFDNTLQKFTKVLDLVSDQGELAKLLDESYKINKTKLDEFKKKASDTSLSVNQRAFYEKQIPRFETAIEGVNGQKLAMIRKWNDLSKSKKEIESSKQIFIDAATVKDVEAANECMQQLNNSLDNLQSAVTSVMEMKSEAQTPALK